MAGAAFVTDLTEILTQAAEAAAGIAAIITGYKLLDIQRDYYDLYRRQREFYYDTFQQGVEKPLAEDTYDDLPYSYNYAARVAELADATFGPMAGPAFDANAWWARHASNYSAPQDANMLRELPFELARIKTDWCNYMMRFEEHFYDIVNDRRWQRRFAVHNIGIKQGTAVVTSLNDSLSGYTDHLVDLNSQLATYANGAAKHIGYRRGLSNTADDFDRMGYRAHVQPAQTTKLLGPYQPPVRNNESLTKGFKTT